MICPYCQKKWESGTIHHCPAIKPSEIKFVGFMALGGEGAFESVFRGRTMAEIRKFMDKQIPDNWNDLEDNAVIYDWPSGEMTAFYSRNGWVEP